jgi:adenosylmethionine-8-amino-7-oxononanoate aminotransferase
MSAHQPVAAPLANDDPWALDRAHVLHPWTHFGSFEREGALVMDRGEGARLWDGAGREYLDAVGGMWCTNIGLGRAEMAQAIADQAMKLGYANHFVDVTNAPAARLAGAIAERAPVGLSRVHFTTGGSTAVDTAVRMAAFYHTVRGNPGKTGIVARENSYHGSTYLCQSVGKRDGDRIDEFRYQTEGIWHLASPNPYRRPEGMTEAQFCDSLVAEFAALIESVGADRIGAFIAEPIQASGGIIIPPEGYFPRMAALCRQHDILIIADEVVTAWGRLGTWFAMEDMFGVRPDMITSAKGLTSGYVPLGALIFSDEIWATMAEGGQRWFTTGFTYSGHPVACAAGLKNIEILEREGLLAQAARVGAYFQERLASLSDLPLVGDVRGRGLMACVENVADKGTKAPLPDGARESKRISDACEAMGLLVRPIGHLNVMSPPLIITEAEVDFITERLGRAIRQVTDDLTREGWRLG